MFKLILFIITVLEVRGHLEGEEDKFQELEWGFSISMKPLYLKGLCALKYIEVCVPQKHYMSRYFLCFKTELSDFILHMCMYMFKSECCLPFPSSFLTFVLFVYSQISIFKNLINGYSLWVCTTGTQ